MSNIVKQFCKDMGYTETVTMHTCNMERVLEDYSNWKIAGSIQTATGKDLDILANIPVRELGVTDTELRERYQNESNI